MACRRCHPLDEPLSAQHQKAVERACRILEDSEETPRLEELAAASGFSGPHFQRMFKKMLGVSPADYAAACKAKRLTDSLASGMPVTDSVYQAGYGSSSRVYEKSADLLGMTPAKFRAGGKGENIRFAASVCDLGHVIVAVTDKGICSVALGDDIAALEAQLRQRFSAAQITKDPHGLALWLQTILALLEHPKHKAEFPLDIRGTAFQHRVWQALRRIPVGETRSYGKLAEELGRPGAARAVARACASNELALLIPCHRVIRGDGEPGGYRWGLDRKKKLLESEQPKKKPGQI